MATKKQLANRKKWVKALRSGKYKQAEGQLRDGDRFCCLGVLCDVLGMKWNGNEVAGKSLSLPKFAQRAVGLRRDEGEHGDEQETLSGYNDFGKDFAYIADIIESAPKGLFRDGTK